MLSSYGYFGGLMADSETTEAAGSSLVSIIAATAVPVTLQTAFLKVASRLGGSLLAYPVAWLRRPLQRIEDCTDAKSTMVKALAAAAAAKAVEDPDIIDWAVSSFLPEEARKARNKANILCSAAEQIMDEEQCYKPDDSPPGDVDEDWLNAFIRYAEDASSDRMQKLWARVLTGEVKSPGKFSRATLRCLAELELETAQDVELLRPFVFQNCAYGENSWNEGEWYLRSLRLESCGIISGAGGSTHTQLVHDLNGINIFGGDEFGLVIYNAPKATTILPAMAVTRIGRDMLSLVPPVSEYECLTSLGKRISSDGVYRVSIGRLRLNENKSLSVLSPIDIWEKPNPSHAVPPMRPTPA